MGRSTSKQKANRDRVDSDFERARTRVRSKRNVVAALNDVKRTTSPSTLIEVAAGFGAHPAYRQLVWKGPFPGSFRQLTERGFPGYLDFRSELAWTVGLLIANKDRLTSFVSIRRQLESAALTAAASSVSTLLDEIEEELGVSMWLLDARLNLAQATLGVGAKNRLLKEQTSDTSHEHLVRYFTSWLAYRSNADVSLSEMDRLLAERAALDNGVSYLTHLLMGRCPPTTADMLAQAISYADTLPAVDRYTLLLMSLQAFVAQSSDGAAELSFIRSCLEQLYNAIPDPLTMRLLAVLGHSPKPNIDGELLGILDAYTAGRYADVIAAVQRVDDNSISIELANAAIRASLLSATAVDIKTADGTVLADMLPDLRSVINFEDGAAEARQRLERTCQTFSLYSWTSSLASILERQRRDERAFGASALQRYHALRCSSETPLFAFGIPPAFRRAYLNEARADHPSVTIESMLSVLGAGETQGDQVPAERRLRTSAMAHVGQGRTDLAIRALTTLTEDSDQTLTTLEAATLLVRCLLSAGQISEAADLAVTMFLRSRYFAVVLPITDIVSAVLPKHDEPMAQSPLRGRLGVAIVFDMYSRYVASDHEAERADAFKDVLRKRDVDKASQLLGKTQEFPLEALIYFLRYVCVPDVLDQSLALKSSREVEAERTVILLGLSELLGPGPELAAIKDELNEIRTRQVVRETSRQLDQSKVYVNVDGIRRSIDVTMKENWNRYKLIQLQTEEVSEPVGRLRHLLKDKLGDRFTIIDLSSPLTEGASLFRRMIGEIRDHFTSNREFGLNSNLSTNIRHGYVLRELRGPLLSRNLITNKDSESGSYLPNAYWRDRTRDYDDAERLDSILSEFSGTIDGLIDDLTKRLLQIRSDKNPQGLFEYEFSEFAMQPTEEKWRQLENYDDFISAVFDALWNATEQNLARVRDKLLTEILADFNRALSDLEARIRAEQLASMPFLVGAITMVRQEVREAFDRVVSWFRLSKSQEYQDFDLKIAFEAGLQSVKAYYSNLEIAASYRSDQDLSMHGWTLPAFARLFFLLLDNAAAHGAGDRSELSVSVDVQVEDGEMSLTIANDLAAGHDLGKLQARIAQINNEYGQSTAAEKVGQEGGSGYPKVWKLLSFDLGKQHGLRVELEGDKFSVTIAMPIAGIVQ